MHKYVGLLTKVRKGLRKIAKLTKKEDFDPTRREFLKYALTGAVGAAAFAATKYTSLVYAQELIEQLRKPTIDIETAVQLPFVRIFRCGDYVVAVNKNGDRIAKSDEHNEVFDYVFRLVDEGKVSGLIVDHGSYYFYKSVKLPDPGNPWFLYGSGNRDPYWYDSWKTGTVFVWKGDNAGKLFYFDEDVNRPLSFAEICNCSFVVHNNAGLYLAPLIYVKKYYLNLKNVSFGIYRLQSSSVIGNAIVFDFESMSKPVLWENVTFLWEQAELWQPPLKLINGMIVMVNAEFSVVKNKAIVIQGGGITAFWLHVLGAPQGEEASSFIVLDARSAPCGFVAFYLGIEHSGGNITSTSVAPDAPHAPIKILGTYEAVVRIYDGYINYRSSYTGKFPWIVPSTANAEIVLVEVLLNDLDGTYGKRRVTNMFKNGVPVATSGTATLSGDGVTTDFLLGTHGVYNITDPSVAEVICTPASEDADVASPVTCYLSDEDADGIYESIRAKFANAPAQGTDNVKIRWTVKRRDYMALT